MTPKDFIAKWGAPDGVPGSAYTLNEEQGAQSHFLDLCELLQVPKPGSTADYKFEEKSQLIGARTGYADVFLRGHFAWENKAPKRDLDAALRQLLGYSLALDNPPLLIVCDRLTTRIHTQFNGHPSETHTVLLEELDQPEKQALLRRLWTDVESFRPKKTTRDITEAAARSFATLADGLRKRGHDADEVAHFLTQCLFCFFAEDVGLLPGRMFEGLVNNKALTSDKLTQGLTNLFGVMWKGGLYGNDDIPWFNGGLFKKVNVPALSIMEVTELRNAAALNWSAIDVSIFGTLFERGLDPSKRSQLGAHYTDPVTILRIVEPVLMRPLLQKWELLAQEIRGLLAKNTKKGDKHYRSAQAKFVLWLEDLKDYRVLDPACGSGNFLFLGLKALKDIEHMSHIQAAAMGLDRQADLVTGPHNVLGIELNEYAAELARLTVWIGELQWRIEHGYEFKTNPVLEPLDHIECRDALLCFSDSGARAGQMPGAHASKGAAKSPPTSAPPTPRSDLAVEADWPKASVVIGNPPFLGDRKMIRELGENYTFTLRKVYEGRVPGGADLVCYWFEKARKAIEANGLGAAGLVSTNSIRGGANRKVLEAICDTTRIYEAWSDEGWVNEGAAVRVSLVAFGHASQTAQLNGIGVDAIAADLSPQKSGDCTDLTNATKLTQNANASFIGTQKNGPFDVSRDQAANWLLQPNPHGKSNALVVRPWANGLDVTRRPQNRWVVDFGCDTPLADAALFELPFAYVQQHVKPTRANVRRDFHRNNWWLYGDARPGLRKALAAISRFVVTPMVAKHRVLAWMPATQIPENLCVAITRADDTTFGILHSRFHELWSLRMCTWLGVGNDPRYTPTTCFETFPFPAGLTPADTAHQRTETLENGAVIPADFFESNQPPAHVNIAKAAMTNIAFSNQIEAQERAGAGVGQRLGPISEPQVHEATASAPHPPLNPPSLAPGVRHNAIAIATAAKHLNDLRENWLNPREWTERVPEVIPLGMDKSPYPDRILPKHGHEKDLAERTLTKLYNQRPAWLIAAHQALNMAVAQAYGWNDYTPGMPDEEILKRLLALNLQRSGGAA